MLRLSGVYVMKLKLNYSQFSPICLHHFYLQQSRYFDCDDDDSDTFSNNSDLLDSEFLYDAQQQPQQCHQADDNIYYCDGNDGFCSYANQSDFE